MMPKSSEIEGLTPEQEAALRDLASSPDGSYRVNWRPKLSDRAHDDLRKRGLITECWTWASTARPDTAITDAGRADLSARQHP